MAALQARRAIVAAAYGQILRQPVLDLPPLGVLNIHPSLLPKYRGRFAGGGRNPGRRRGDGRDDHAHGPGARRGAYPQPASRRNRPARHDGNADRTPRRRRGRPAHGDAAALRRRLASAAAAGRVACELRVDGEEGGRRSSIGRCRRRRSGGRCAPTTPGRWRFHASRRRGPADSRGMAADGRERSAPRERSLSAAGCGGTGARSRLRGADGRGIAGGDARPEGGPTGAAGEGVPPRRTRTSWAVDWAERSERQGKGALPAAGRLRVLLNTEPTRSSLRLLASSCLRGSAFFGRS